MKDKKENKHESFGMINICRYSGGNGQFFGSDLIHNGGISITINTASVKRDLSTNWYHSNDELIRVELSYNQFVDAITSGMNTGGVPCTIKRFNGELVEQIDHVQDRKELFSNEIKESQQNFKTQIDEIVKLLDGNIGKRKASEIKHQLEVLKSHISSNTNYVMKCFNESMEKTVLEAKHSIANYIDHKVHTMGIEAFKSELQLSIENK